MMYVRNTMLKLASEQEFEFDSNILSKLIWNPALDAACMQKADQKKI